MTSLNSNVIQRSHKLKWHFILVKRFHNNKTSLQIIQMSGTLKLFKVKTMLIRQFQIFHKGAGYSYEPCQTKEKLSANVTF